VASRRPLAPIEPQVRDERLAATAGGRLVLALLDLHAQVQGSVSRAVLDEIEADRAARLEIIERLGAEVGHLAHENAVMRGELDGLRPAYAFGESDREARLRVIEDLGRQLSEAQHSLAAERGEHGATRIALETSEAEDIARLKVIEDQVRQLSELERTIAELRDQTQALRDKNVELEPRANRSIFQLILARLRGKP
jgi:chromosome segregation ATPase